MLDAAPEKKQSVIGCKQHSHADRGVDLYQTPPEATQALLRAEWLPRTIWEPACGPGAMVDVLRKAGHRVHASDVVDYGCEGQWVQDFLTAERGPDDWECPTIVTNPPFKLAAEFVRHALDLGAPKVCMLLRLAFLESDRRSGILDNSCLARVYPFIDRLPRMHREGWEGPKCSSAVPFAWFVWDRSHHGVAQLRRLRARGDVSRT
jgi:hypothetical protein